MRSPRRDTFDWGPLRWTSGKETSFHSQVQRCMYKEIKILSVAGDGTANGARDTPLGHDRQYPDGRRPSDAEVVRHICSDPPVNGVDGGRGELALRADGHVEHGADGIPKHPDEVAEERLEGRVA